MLPNLNVSFIWKSAVICCGEPSILFSSMLPQSKIIWCFISTTLRSLISAAAGCAPPRCVAKTVWQLFWKFIEQTGKHKHRAHNFFMMQQNLFLFKNFKIKRTNNTLIDVLIWGYRGIQTVCTDCNFRWYCKSSILSENTKRSLCSLWCRIKRFRAGRRQFHNRISLFCDLIDPIRLESFCRKKNHVTSQMTIFDSHCY